MQLFQLSWEPARAAGLSQRPAGSTNSGKHWEQTFLPPVMSSLHPRHRTSKRSPIMQRNPPAFNQPARISTIRPGLPTSSSPHKANQFGMKPPGSYSPNPAYPAAHCTLPSLARTFPAPISHANPAEQTPNRLPQHAISAHPKHTHHNPPHHAAPRRYACFSTTHPTALHHSFTCGGKTCFSPTNQPPRTVLRLAGTSQAAEKLNQHTVLKVPNFSRANKANRRNGLYRLLKNPLLR